MFKFMLTILGAVSEIERELTVERIREDMAKEKRYGTRSGTPVGRLPRQILANHKKYYLMWEDGDITTTDFVRLRGVSRPTLYQYIRKHEAQLNIRVFLFSVFLIDKVPDCFVVMPSFTG